MGESLLWFSFFSDLRIPIHFATGQAPNTDSRLQIADCGLQIFPSSQISNR